VLVPGGAQRLVHRSQLDELRPGADHAQYSHLSPVSHAPLYANEW
jgi:hypothetical protein